MRIPQTLAGAGLIAAMTVTACTPPTPQAAELARIAQEQHWGPQQWADFHRLVDVVGISALCESANNGDHDAVRALIGLIFPDAYDTFTRIVERESGFDAGAYNRSGASGLLQIMSPLHDWRYRARGLDPHTARFDACQNLTVGRDLYDESGTAPWALTR